MNYRELWEPLSERYGEGEGKAMARYLLEEGYDLTMADILCGGVERLPSDEIAEKQQRMLQGEPVQYVIGKASFGGRLFHVTPDVLIPRPETYELCQWVRDVIEERREERGERKEEREHILDIGTGSGCIAITLALDIPHAKVEAWDISEPALQIAKKNATALQAPVIFHCVDVLSLAPSSFSPLNYIISNPPYICQKEADSMESVVLDHEPHEALFVPDEDPLLFYRTIARLGQKVLAQNGMLFFEMNPIYHQSLVDMLDEMDYSDIETRKDQFGKFRFVKARKSC